MPEAIEGTIKEIIWSSKNKPIFVITYGETTCQFFTLLGFPMI